MTRTKLSSYVRPCKTCGEIHCYWCGLPFGTYKNNAPTRDHIRSKPKVAASAIVVAHRPCNNYRQHLEWSEFHSGRQEKLTKGQHEAYNIVVDALRQEALITREVRQELMTVIKVSNQYPVLVDGEVRL